MDDAPSRALLTGRRCAALPTPFRSELTLMSPLIVSGPNSGSYAPVAQSPARLSALTLGALGVVYGDIGTSPLYAFRETLRAVSGDGITEAEVIGIVSLLIWTLMIIVTLKYVVFLLNADNLGEGGDLALFARIVRVTRKRTPLLIALGIAGASFFFFGDAILTPAISVLAAVEGMEFIVPGFDPYVLPVAMGVLVALFLSQRWGTGRISFVFGPVMALWFLTLAGSGLNALLEAPEMLFALSPHWGIAFLLDHGGIGLIVLSGVFLAVTGAEALYADLGHFGRAPIRLAWSLLVLPALVLNYLGQGALVLTDPAAAANPFFLLVSENLRPALVALATLATIIAAQAVITGAFSLARQALQLGFLPRLLVLHTSGEHEGQIYIPALNALLMVGVILLMEAFGSSSNLASAYGIAVSSSMIITTSLGWIYRVQVRGVSRVAATALVVPVAAIELGFIASNLLKVLDGGYVPLIIAAFVMVAMGAWVRGARKISESAHNLNVGLDSFMGSMSHSSVARVPGIAIFMTSDTVTVPPALLHNLKHNKVLHERNVLLRVDIANRPYLPEEERCQYQSLGPGFESLTLRFGFMESPNVSRALPVCRRYGLKFDVMMTSFFLGRRRTVVGSGRGLSFFLDKLYVVLTRMAADPIDYFYLPRDRVVEIGARVSI